jgi:hypothetical protein
MVRGRRSVKFGWHAAVAVAVLSAALGCGPAQAAGLFDFLFHPFQDQQPQSPAQSYAAPERVEPVPLGPQSVRQGSGDTGHVVAYCVRLCDGQHFPLEHMTNATPVETCRAMCPGSKTKVFFGSEIGGAVAKDGAHYADLDTAFIYRKQLVANCTCNGKNAFGLAPFDLSTDPTLRPGDIVATKQGLMAYAGRTGATAQFTPVAGASAAAALNPVTARVPRRAQVEQQTAEDDPGTIAMPQSAPPPVNLGANLRGPAAR